MATLNEYQIFIDQINKLTEHRQSVSAVYLSVNAAIMTVLTFLVKEATLTGWKQQISLLMLLVSAILACGLWRRLIIQYSTLLGWWYIQLRNLEETLPESNKIFCREYQELYSGEYKKTPIGITSYETRLTWLFTMLYMVFALAIFYILIFDKI